MPTVIASGTVTPTTLAVEQAFAAADTSNKTYVLVIDTVNLALGETLDLRLATIVLSGGTERTCYGRNYSHVQAEPIKYSPPVPANISFRAYLTQTGGTLRAYPWAILAL